jgi:hypothetical protein
MNAQSALARVLRFRQVPVAIVEGPAEDSLQALHSLNAQRAEFFSALEGAK